MLELFAHITRASSTDSSISFPDEDAKTILLTDSLNYVINIQIKYSHNIVNQKAHIKSEYFLVI